LRGWKSLFRCEGALFSPCRLAFRGMVWLVILRALAGAQGALIEAQVLSVSGRATVVRGSAGPGPLPINRGDLLLPGYTLDTGVAGRLVIGLSDGSQLVVHPRSRLVMRDFLQANSLCELFEIVVGRVRVKVNHFGRRPNPYHVTSPAATIAVRGTDFQVSVAASGETQVIVYDGLVEVTSRFDPRQRALIAPGRSVIVRPGGDISFFAPGPGSELSATAKLGDGKVEPWSEILGSYEEYVTGLVGAGAQPAPARYAAFADPHFDSLENPAYAAEFTQAEGRLYLLPSFNGARQSVTSSDLSMREAIRPLDSTLFTQTTYFSPLGESGFVLGGAASMTRASLQAFTLYDSTVGATTIAQNSSTRMTTVNTSLILARRLGSQDRTSLGLKVDQLAGRGVWVITDNYTFAGRSRPARFESRADIDRTRLTLGLTHDFAGGRKLGIYYRQGVTSARDLDRNALPEETDIDQLLDQHFATQTSEIGLRRRSPLTRRFFYGVEGSLLYERNSHSIQNNSFAAMYAEETGVGIHRRIRRATLGGGIGIALRPQTVFSFDVAGGTLQTTSRAVFEPTKRKSNGKFDYRFLSLHAGAQTDLWRRFLVSGSLLTTIEPGARPHARNFFSSFGAGWRINPSLLAQYIISTDYGRNTPSHSLMLRYTFDFAGKK